jgi:hypothetical protein
MGTDSLDPVIHAPARLRIAATLARAPGRGHAGLRPPAGHARPDPGSLITHLRKLEDAGYLTSAASSRR